MHREAQLLHIHNLMSYTSQSILHYLRIIVRREVISVQVGPVLTTLHMLRLP